MYDIVFSKFPQFGKSLSNHQQLVNIIAWRADKSGTSRISQVDMSTKIGKSVNWVSSAIKRLNTLDTCIDKISPQQYRVMYTDISSQGIFATIGELLFDYLRNPSMLSDDAQALADEYDVPITVIYMFVAYASAR